MYEIMRRKHASFPIWVLSIMTIFISLPGLLAEDAKLTVEDIVERHLASIGTPEARAAIQSRVVSGTVQMVSQRSLSQLSGKANILSEGRKLRYEMNFGAPGYPGARFSFDGRKAFFVENVRYHDFNLSWFLDDNKVILKEGLLGGTLSTAWPLLDLETRQAKLNYNGLKKIEGKELHEVEYRAKKGGGVVKVHLYFDPENFRHVRTRYRLEQYVSTPGTMGPATIGPATIAGSRYHMENIQIVVEQFDNFKKIDGLTLPQTYRLEYSTYGGASVINWDVSVTQIMQDQQIDPQSFTIK